jgi:hypothetical protein
MGDSISLIGLDDKSAKAGPLGGTELGDYKISSEHWIPAGRHTLRLALPLQKGNGVTVKGDGPSGEVTGDFEAGVVYLISKSEADKPNFKITQEGPWSPPQE